MKETTRTLLNKGEARDNRSRSYSTLEDSYDASITSSSSCTEMMKNRIYFILSSCCNLNPLVASSIGLVLATAIERVSFKIMIDRMLPYKFVLVEIIFALTCALFTSATLWVLYSTNQITAEMRQFPQWRIFTMAVLDTMQFLLFVYSGAGVSPTMTVILMHTSTFFVVLGSKVVFPNRKYSLAHTYGMFLMGFAIFFSLVKIVWYDSTENSDFSDTWSSLVYVGAASLQGLSTLYKEHCLACWSRPIDLYYLSAYLFFYQFFVTIAFSALFYGVSDLIGSQISMTHGFYYGWKCFLGQTPAVVNRDDDLTLYVDCSASLWVILGYVISTFCVVVCLHYVLETGSQLVPRLLCAAISAAFVVLWAYDCHFSQYEKDSYIFGGRVGIADLLAIVLLVVGTEVYGRDPEPDVELITHYSNTNVSRPIIPEAPSAAASEFVALTRDGSNKTVLRQ